VAQILARITSKYFVAGIVLDDALDQVIDASPIVGYMKKGKWSRGVVRAYCKAKGWEIKLVKSGSSGQSAGAAPP
jgi:hypothetical protein